MINKIGRNDPCSCGSGKKYKQCCSQLVREQPVSVRPSTAEIANAFQAAVAHHQAGHLDQAEAIYRQILQVAPNHPDTLHLLGLIAHHLGKHEIAVELISKALAFIPDFAEAHFNLGVALKAQGKLAEAVVSYRKVVSLNPDCAEAYYNLGNALKDQGEMAEAVVSYRKAVSLQPGHVDAHHNLGNALKAQGKLAEAVVSYRMAVSLQPDYADAHYNLGVALKDQGEQDEALASLHQALALNPDDVHARWAIVISQIPALFSVNQDLQCGRKQFSKELEELDMWFDASRTGEGFEAIGHVSPFYLAYQEEDNKPLLSQYGALSNRLMAHWQNLQGYRCGLGSSEGRIKIGIVNIINHSVWNALIKGWMQHLDRSRFELHVFYLGTKPDPETEVARSLATTFVQGHASLAQWAEAILAQQIDALIFPEIGMDPMTEQLANLRLAQVQLATWGHPETTGLPTIDYYVSAMDLEPDNADDYYTEKLIKLPNLGCCYQSLPVNAADPDLTQLGIRPNEPLLLCPGTPYKYAPQYDWILVEIARRLGRCQLIFFVPESEKDLSARLRERLRLAFKTADLDFDDFGVFLPWLEKPVFYGLMQHADVYLDTIGFSGFNTAMQAVECGLPIVTREGRFMRGRLASGILKRMKLQELVVSNEEDYIELAVKLVRDKEYQRTIRERIEESRSLLFEDMEPIRALEDFLVGTCRPVRKAVETMGYVALHPSYEVSTVVHVGG